MTITVTTDRGLIYNTIGTWLGVYSGLGVDKIAFSSQEASRLVKPYASVMILNRGIKTGFDDVISTFDVPTQKIQRITAGPRLLICQIEVFTDPATEANDTEADEILENALLALGTEEVKELFRAAKIGQLTETPVNRLDEQLGERWERRAQSDVTFSYSGETFDDGATSGNWVETVEAPTEENGNLIINE
jgi:hypothetical protein